jgi:hypothetical protein
LEEEASDIPTRAGNAFHEARADRVGHSQKYDRDRPRLPLKCSSRSSRTRNNNVRLQANQLSREQVYSVRLYGPTNVHPQVAAFGPTQIEKCLLEKAHLRLSLRVVFADHCQHADPPHAIGLLGTRCKWTDCRTA